MNVPTTVPWTMVPFLSSIVTVSFVSFIKNLPNPSHRSIVSQSVNQHEYIIDWLWSRSTRKPLSLPLATIANQALSRDHT